MQQKNRENFFFSILTAIATGLTISLVLVFLIKYSKNIFNSINVKKTNTASINETKDYTQNEEDEDQTYISKFSRAYIYSREYEGEVIEKAQDSLPKSYKQGEITAKAFGVIDLDRDITLLEKESGTHFPIASITKLVTAVIAKKLINEHSLIEITDKVLASNGSSAHFRLGEKFSYDELLYPLVLALLRKSRLMKQMATKRCKLVLKRRSGLTKHKKTTLKIQAQFQRLSANFAQKTSNYQKTSKLAAR
jgi:MFS superfamily sulfate permease-like transporter